LGVKLKTPLTVAWIPDFPAEWLAQVPQPLQALPRRHPATWQIALLSEFEQNPDLRVHVLLVRQRIERGFKFERKGVTFHVLKAPTWARVASLFWLETILMRRVCRRIQPDLVHAWGMEKGAPVIAHRLGYPYVMTIQGLYAWYKETVRFGIYDRLIERLERRCLPRATVVSAESTFTVGYVRKLFPKVEVMHAEHVPNPAFFQVRRRPQFEPVHFIFVGTLDFRKGADLLVQALEELLPRAPFALTVITHPQYEGWLKKAASADLWSRIRFKADLLPDDVAKEFEHPTMMLMPTRADTGPLAVKEAVVAGVPVVGSKVGGIPDYVIPGRNGFLFPPGDLAGFKEGIRSACAHPLYGRGEVEPETLARMRAYLSPEAMARNFLKAYDMALGKERGEVRNPKAEIRSAHESHE
jgi:glycosyltransferase involved in cell wall biosynthesis